MDCLRPARQRGYEDLDDPRPDDNNNNNEDHRATLHSQQPTFAANSPGVATPSNASTTAVPTAASSSLSSTSPAAAAADNAAAAAGNSSPSSKPPTRVILKANARGSRSPSSSSTNVPVSVAATAAATNPITPPPTYDEALLLPLPNRAPTANAASEPSDINDAAGSPRSTPPPPPVTGGGGLPTGSGGADVIVATGGYSGNASGAGPDDAVVVVPKRKKLDGRTDPNVGGGRGGRGAAAAAAAGPKRSRNVEDVLKTENLLKDGKNVLCPICMGIGKIPKEEEKHRVALIAADDERLKPSRTWWYVLGAVITTVVLAGLIMFFLYPRSFTIYQHIGKDYCGPKLKPYNLTIDTTNKIVNMKVTNWWKMENPNYYPIQLVSMNVQVYHDKMLTERSNSTIVPVAMRSISNIYMDLEITIRGDLDYLVQFCADKRNWVHIILIRSQVTAVVKVMDANFTSITETYQKVSCGFDQVTTPSPPIRPRENGIAASIWNHSPVLNDPTTN